MDIILLYNDAFSIISCIIFFNLTECTSYVEQQLGLLNQHVLTGPDLYHMSDEVLVKQANEVDIFAEIEPNQKEPIILALRKKEKNVIGYMGDGINDASALHSADAGISINTAADVVKEAADFVLLE